MRFGWAAVLVTATVALALPAQAAPGTVSLRAELPLEFDGPHQATGDASRFLLEGPDGQVTLSLQGDGEATRVIHRMWGYVNAQDPKLGVVWDDSVKEVGLPLGGATLSLAERRADFALLAYDGDLTLASGGHDQPLLVGALDAPKTVDYTLDQTLLVRLSPPSDDDQFEQVLPAGTLQSRATDGLVTADGALRLFITDAVVAYTDAAGTHPILAHFREETVRGTLYNPLTGTWSGPGEHTEYVQEYVRVDAVLAHLEVAYTGVPASLYSERASVALDGVARIPAATGTVTVTEDGQTTRHALNGDDLELAGRFTLRAHDVVSTPARAQLDGDGDFTAVSYAGTQATYDWTAAAAAAGLGAITLAALGWLAFHAKTAGPAIGGLVAGYARVSGQEILEHPGRQEVYERIKAEPGVSFTQLAERVPFGASALSYHIRVLERNEYIATVKDGRYLRFFDRQAGTYAGPRKHAVSALRNTTTAAMARHIRANPGVAQRDLAAAFGVTASTVNWHMARLAQAGLVTRTRDAHFTRHYLAEGWSQLPAEEQARFQAPVPVLA